jgi:hypothetical protein
MADTQRTSMSSPFKRLWIRENVISTVLAIFLVVSLGLHAFTFISLLRVRNTINRQLDISANQMAQVRQQKVRYVFPVDQTFTIDTTVPISETVEVPLNLTVPISETVQIPIETPLGIVPLEVPINLTVPITETVTVPINKQIPFRTDIPVQTDIPVDLDLNGPPIGPILRQFEDALRELRDNL